MGLSNLELLPLIVAMLVTGAVAGVLAGLLGIGGGIIIVPVLFVALGKLGIDPAIQMHVAVATSMGSIVLTSISSALAHYRRRSMDVDLIKRWGVSVLVGAILGVYIASLVESPVLTAVFAVVALVVAAKMLLPLDDVVLAGNVPSSAFAQVIPLTIGLISTMMGIGGGVLGVPTLTFCSYPIRLAVGTSALLGLVISIPAATGYIIAGWGHLSLPAGSVGYVNLIGVALIAPVTVALAPVGAGIAHRISTRRLSILFGLFLILASSRLFYSLL